MPDKYGLFSPEEWHRLFDQVDEILTKDPEHPLLKGKVHGNPIQTRPPWDPNPDRWEQGVTTVGGQRWEEGISNPRQDFKSAALANNEGWKAGVQAAVAGDRFAKGMQGADVDEAIATAKKIGAVGYANGAVARKEKFRRKTDAIRGAMSAVVQKTRSRPAKTLQDRIARAVNQIQGAAAAGGRTTGGR